MNKNQKIALFAPSLQGGGAERIMVTLANNFVRAGFIVDLVLATATGPYRSEILSAVNIVDLKRNRAVLSLPGLMHYLIRERPTVLLSAMGHANLIALIAKRLTGSKTRVVISEHCIPSDNIKKSKDLRFRIMYYLSRLLYPSADGIVAVSNGVADSLAKIFGIARENITVIYNPIVSDEMLEFSEKTVNYTWLLDFKRPLILAVGRLVEEKDFTTLIRAFAIVREKFDVQLVILGEGELRGKLEYLVSQLNLQKSVILPGFVINPYAVMRQAQLFVLSSREEGFGNALVESMAIGIPVVSTGCPSGPSEILENGKWGRIVPVGDEEALASAICLSMSEKEHPDVTKRASFFSVDRAIKGYLRLLVDN